MSKRGDLHRLPVADAVVDVVVGALALVHVPVLSPVVAEFPRVLRPGGHLVVSDVHRDLVTPARWCAHLARPASRDWRRPTATVPVTTYAPPPCRQGCRSTVAVADHAGGETAYPARTRPVGVAGRRKADGQPEGAFRTVSGLTIAVFIGTAIAVLLAGLLTRPGTGGDPAIRDVLGVQYDGSAGL